MSLSEFLQCEDVMRCTREGNPEKLLDTLIMRGSEWFAIHAENQLTIRTNLEAFGFPADTNAIAHFQHHLILHYYEKLLGICLPPQRFSQYLKTHIEVNSGIKQIKDSLYNNRAVLLASSHFGGVELSAPLLAHFNLPVNAVLRFKTETLAELASQRSQQLMTEADFGKIALIQIGRPGKAAAMDMAAALRRKEILLSIFDEKTEYSKQVSLFGKTVWGGAGIDKIIRFSGVDIDVYSLFMIRTGTDKYRLHLDRINQSSSEEELLGAIYSSLEKVVAANPEQWYFLHEDIPFVS